MTKEILNQARDIQSSIKFLNSFKNNCLNHSKEKFLNIKNNKLIELDDLKLILADKDGHFGYHSREWIQLFDNILYSLPNELKQEILEELNLLGPNGFIEQELNNISNIVDTKINYYQNKMKEL